MDALVMLGIRRAGIAAVVCAAVMATSAAASDPSRDSWKWTYPIDMPYKCSNGQAMQYCRDSSPCRSKVCRPGYYCVESYCGSCSATCIRSRSKASCGKSGRFSLVCGRDGKTYASLCHSKRAGVKVVSKGACKAADSKCTCDVDYAPVCGTDKKFYINRCVAELCAKVRTTSWSTCEAQAATVPDPDCICPLNYDPVCGVDDITYGNACAAGCFNVAVAFKGECPCKKANAVCDLAKNDCCEGFKCIQYPVVCPDVTNGKCWNATQPAPVG